MSANKLDANKGLELTQMQRSARGVMMWRARIIEQSESVSGSSSSLKRYMVNKGGKNCELL